MVSAVVAALPNTPLPSPVVGVSITTRNGRGPHGVGGAFANFVKTGKIGAPSRGAKVCNGDSEAHGARLEELRAPYRDDLEKAPLRSEDVSRIVSLMGQLECEVRSTLPDKLSRIEECLNVLSQRDSLENHRQVLETRLDQYDVKRGYEAKHSAATSRRLQQQLDKLESVATGLLQKVDRMESERTETLLRADTPRTAAAEHQISKKACAAVLENASDAAVLESCTRVELAREVQRLRGMVECMEQVMPPDVQATLAFLGRGASTRFSDPQLEVLPSFPQEDALQQSLSHAGFAGDSSIWFENSIISAIDGVSVAPDTIAAVRDELRRDLGNIIRSEIAAHFAKGAETWREKLKKELWESFRKEFALHGKGGERIRDHTSSVSKLTEELAWMSRGAGFTVGTKGEVHSEAHSSRRRPRSTGSCAAGGRGGQHRCSERGQLNISMPSLPIEPFARGGAVPSTHAQRPSTAACVVGVSLSRNALNR